MRPLLEEVSGFDPPETLVERLAGEPGLILLQSSLGKTLQGRYSFVTARPFLGFRSMGSRCIVTSGTGVQELFGNPWHILDALMARCELLDEVDLPFPLGGCFGYWGFDLKNFVEPKLARRATTDLEVPDCHVGFYSSLVLYDQWLSKAWIVSTGLTEDGSRDPAKARQEADFWRQRLREGSPPQRSIASSPHGPPRALGGEGEVVNSLPGRADPSSVTSTLPRRDFVSRVEQAQKYIRAGDIYQVNLAQRFSAPLRISPWELYLRLHAVSPAPYAAYLDAGEFQLVSSSPECFLRISGGQIRTRPIKGTRPRSSDPTRDAQLGYELQTSGKERSELVMITDLMRNDLGRVCEFGSIHVPELMRLERYAQVQHLVSTVEGQLRAGVSHFQAFASCFPGGSITGAPKFRAMEIIDELEPVTRGPYTGCLGYLGFNRESQLSIIIRTALCDRDVVYFHSGAGIVAESDPGAEFEETMAKAAGFFAALEMRDKITPVMTKFERGSDPGI